MQAALEANGTISRAEAIALTSVHVETLLLGERLDGKDEDGLGYDLVATNGGELLGFEGKVVGVVSSARGVVDLL